MIKQVIVIRKDLNMRKGKMVAQGAHASMAALLGESNELNIPGGTILELDITQGSPLGDWLSEKFTKICVGCNSEEELLELYYKARKSGIITALIEDSGATEFNGIPTKTCVAIGPDESEKIDEITGHLKLL